MGLCDVVISGVPGEEFKFPTRLLREGAVCINFSTDKVSAFVRCGMDWDVGSLGLIRRRTSDQRLRSERQYMCRRLGRLRLWCC